MGTVPVPAIKAERKKPVRKAPVQKDYPNKLAWLKAMTEFETKQEQVTNTAKIARLDKRIQAKVTAIGELRTELDKLTAERAVLNGDVEPVKAEVATPKS